MYKSSQSLTFDLIKTLEPTEKAYIKKHFSGNEKNLKQLFDDLNKEEAYNKIQFERKYKKRAYFIHLSQNKSYLRKKIIDALIQYNSKSLPSINQRYHLNVINVLINKGLYEQAVKLIEQGLKENEKYERYLICYELSCLITSLSNNNVTYTFSKEKMTSFKTKRRFYAHQLFRIEKFAEFADIHYSKSSKEEKIKALQFKLSELEIEEIEDLPDDYPYYTKRIFYYSKNKLAELQNKSSTTYHLLKKGLELYFDNPNFLKENFNSFIADSLNYFDSLYNNKLYHVFFKEYDKIISKIETLLSTKIKNDFITSYYVIKYFYYQLFCNSSKQYQKAFTFSKEYLQFITNKTNLSDQFLAASRVSISVAQINVQRFEEALDAINPIEKTKFYDYQYELRLVQIISHYRLGNDLVLDSLFISFIYYLKKQEKPEQIKAIRTLKKCMEKQNFEALQNVEFEELNSLNVQFALTTTLVPE